MTPRAERDEAAEPKPRAAESPAGAAASVDETIDAHESYAAALRRAAKAAPEPGARRAALRKVRVPSGVDHAAAATARVAVAQPAYSDVSAR